MAGSTNDEGTLLALTIARSPSTSLGQRRRMTSNHLRPGRDCFALTRNGSTAGAASQGCQEGKGLDKVPGTFRAGRRTMLTANSSVVPVATEARTGGLP